MDKFELEKILSEDRKKYQDNLNKITNDILNSIENNNKQIDSKIENMINKIDKNNKWIMSVCITIIIATIILIIKLNS
ncbi:hypothetical protein [Clostridium perfringens]|uniref:hypothetical protein n=1 Tax=Clostridium perfringens TaxID=1502 RepID=UPI00016BD340|nr:hypothetical protein [Clostridium perfringens]